MIFNYKEAGNEFFEKADKLKTDLTKVKRFDRGNIAGELSKILNYIT